ncbi:DUF5723 family protein [Epilithonimonas sp.]|uniref:DUF5723 family protein n=1 Tax=Epilithonimonas sp. TaxID=2894511 RepID=UPI0028A7C77F|nr:DUF5723 family protein [Epilithonimonas sp.]
MLKIFCIKMLGFCLAGVSAQNNLSFLNDTFSGINSAVISPTQPFLSPNPWDANLLSADAFLNNDYAYISSQSVVGLRNATIVTANPNKNISGENQSDVLDFYNKDRANLLFGSDLLGPSLSISARIKERKYVFGIYSRLRTQTSVLGFDNYFRYNNQSISEPAAYSFKPVSGTVMNWGEIGLNFAKSIFPQSEKQWIVGVNVKYEIGLDAANIIGKNLNLISSEPAVTQNTNKRNIYATDYDLSASYITNYNFQSKRYEYKQNGSGIGFDIGIAVIDKDKSEEAYNYKFAVNVLDIGYVNFKKGINHVFRDGNTIWLQNNPVFEDRKFDSPEEFFQTLSTAAYGDANASLQDWSFKIGLPTSINLNYSQRIKEHHYLNFNWIQRIPVFENSVKRNNLVNANYMIQKEAIGFGVSASVSKYRNFNFGGYFRIGPLILGSENAFPLLFNHKHLHAASFYMAIKLYPFWDNEMKRHKRQKCDCEK